MQTRVSTIALIICLLQPPVLSLKAQTLREPRNSTNRSLAHLVVHGTITKIVSDQIGGWYLGGDFDSVGGVAVHSAVHIKSDLSVDQTWIPNVAGWAIVVSDSTVFMAGYTRIVAINRMSGQVTNWVPQLRWMAIHTIAVNDSAVFFAGLSFASGNLFWGFVTAINRKDANRVYWKNSTSGTVNAIAISVSDTLLYFGGGPVGSCDLRTGFLSTWNPNISASLIDDLSVTDSTLYIAGLYSSQQLTRINLATVNRKTGAATNWNPNWTYSDGTTPVITLHGHIAYVGGPFTSIDGQ